MGVAYRSIDAEMQEAVVVKLLLTNLQSQPLMVSLFEESARMQKSLDHPNIAPILRMGREQGISFVVQPYYANGALDRWFRQIDLDIVVQAFRRVCCAVQFAHGQGEIHGDIKSSNVLLGAEGQILLTDFMSTGALSQVLMSAGIRWGTPIYMAPEILTSGRLPDIKADIYALGLLLFETVKGYLPRQLDERVALASRIQAELPLALDPRYGWINDIIGKAVHPDPSQRFSSVQDVIAAIQEPEIDYRWPRYVPIYTPAWLEFGDGRPPRNLEEVTYSVGSGKHCDIVIQAPGVSDWHAEVDFRDGFFLIRRGGENTELYLNGERVHVARILHSGDQIRVGDFRVGDFRVRFAILSRDETRPLTRIQLLPVAWLAELGECNAEQLRVTEAPIRIVDQEGAYVEVRPVADKLCLSISGLHGSVFVNKVPVDSIDLSEGDIIEWNDIRWVVHYTRDGWMEAIDRNLLEHGKVEEHDLLEIPSSCRLIAMREHIAERSYLDISFSKDTGCLRCNDIQRLQLFRQLWADSRVTFAKRIGVEVATELVELIKEKLFVSESASPNDRLGSRYGSFMAFPLEISALAQDSICHKMFHLS
jgi:hypothetical protein